MQRLFQRDMDFALYMKDVPWIYLCNEPYNLLNQIFEITNNEVIIFEAYIDFLIRDEGAIYVENLSLNSLVSIFSSAMHEKILRCMS